jgi:acetyl esterase/lipase
MSVKRSMIHPELRNAGTFARLLMPSFTERVFRWAGPLMRPIRGRCRSRLSYSQEYIQRPDGSILRLCVYQPLPVAAKDAAKDAANDSAKAPLNVAVKSSLNDTAEAPGMVWMHGGGFAMGAPEQDEKYFKRFVDASNCVIVAPDYRLSVDAPYPAALEDCYSALLWLKEHGGSFGVREDQLMVGGSSAGGGLAAALALYARDRGEVAVAFQMPLYPMLDDRMFTPSAKDNDAPVWNSSSNIAGWRLYLGALYGTPDVPAYAAPARATDLSRLPPACTFVGSLEPFRDETVAYMERLAAAGIPVHFNEYDGCYHAFNIVCPTSSIARDAEDFLMTSFRHAVLHYFASQPVC